MITPDREAEEQEYDAHEHTYARDDGAEVRRWHDASAAPPPATARTRTAALVLTPPPPRPSSAQHDAGGGFAREQEHDMQRPGTPHAFDGHAMGH